MSCTSCLYVGQALCQSHSFEKQVKAKQPCLVYVEEYLADSFASDLRRSSESTLLRILVLSLVLWFMQSAKVSGAA